MLINQSSLESVFKAYNAAYKNGFSKATPSWDKIATLIPSTTESNLYAFLGQFPKLREWLGEHVHSQGCKFLPQETLERATGSTIDPPPYLAYLEAKHG